MSIYRTDNVRDKIYDDDCVETEELIEDDDWDEDPDDDWEEGHSRKKPARKDERNSSGFTVKKLFLWAVLLFAAGVFIMYLGIPDKTNFLLMATDEEGTRTDTIMILSFDKNDGKFSIMSIPRDTYVTVTDEMYEEMSAEYPEPGSKSMKINAVHHFSGEKSGASNLESVVESLLGIDIKFYMKIDLDAFRYIVDAIGGVDFYVPCNMVYTDPVQNLRINLTEGMQHLNGEQAEQVVRFRSGYVDADLGRVKVQQQFIQSFISQALSFTTIITHPFAYFNMFINYFDTNFGILNMFSYVFVVIGADVQNIETYTLPGYARYAGGQSVYMLDQANLEAVIANFR